MPRISGARKRSAPSQTSHFCRRTLGLEIRAGLHAGEYKPIGDEVVGIAIHIGARVAAKAGASEVLVSSAVKDLESLMPGIRTRPARSMRRV